MKQSKTSINKIKRKYKKLGLAEDGGEWGSSNYVEEPFHFDTNRPYYGRCGICKKETTDTPYVDDGTEGILYSLLGQIDIVRYITRLIYEHKITAINYEACDRYPYYYCRFCNCNYLLCMKSLYSNHCDPIQTCQTTSSCGRIDIPYFIDADNTVDNILHDIFENDESDKSRFEEYWLNFYENDRNTFWKHRTGEFYPVTMGYFQVLKPNDAFYFIGSCYTCNKICTGTVFGQK